MTLHQLQVERATKTVMVASAMPAEGKTLTAANIALTLSESLRRNVLLMTRIFAGLRCTISFRSPT